MTLNVLKTPQNLNLTFQGPPLSQGPLPAFFYFALSAEDSLTLSPYNQPLEPFHNLPIRLFSASLPAHGPGLSEFHALAAWAEAIHQGGYPLEEFLDQVTAGIEWLFKENIINEKLGLGGLSRGGFFATHLAARIKKTHALLCFAPLTYLNEVEEFKKYSGDSRFMSHIEALNLLPLVEELTHLHFVRFYIGNRDTRVGTDHAYHFIRALADIGHEKKARHMSVEMQITQSIGHKGHGTSPATFQEGGLWLQSKL